MANSFISMLPPAETPSHTEGYEGFFHVMGISGDETLCTVAGLIRDHDAEKFEKRKAALENLASYLNSVWGDGSFELTVKDSYYNMKEKILPHMHLIRNAEKAFEAEGIKPVHVPIRGGTDGARLSYEGLPCPNLSTGGFGFHSCVEFIPVSSMDKMVKVIIRLSGLQ
ncbi:MAG: peptidase T, partial [Clostridia bacterium]|nr:peptidase T [Clostridia bacterium]